MVSSFDSRELENRIRECEEGKKKLVAYLQKLKDKWIEREISYADYESLVAEKRNGKNVQEWFDYYDWYIEECRKRLGAAKKQSSKKILLSALLVIGIGVVAFALIYFSGQEPLLAPEVFEHTESIKLEFFESETISWEPENTGTLDGFKISGRLEGKILIYLEDLLVLDSSNLASSRLTGFAILNETNFSESNKSNEKENVTVSRNESNVTVFEKNNTTVTSEKNQREAERFVFEFDEYCEESCSGINLDNKRYELRVEIENGLVELERFSYTLIQEISSEEKKLVVKEEQKIENGERVVAAFVKDDKITRAVPKEWNIKRAEKIRIYWEEGNEFISADVKDTNGDGFIDEVEWAAPENGEQTYEIIVITQASHLDSGRTFLSDIFSEVMRRDGVFSEEIFDGEYVRVAFEVPLDSSRDITVWPRIVSGNPGIRIYEINETEVIAEFESLEDDRYNTVFLDGLEGLQQEFDLEIHGGSVVFDHIIDPINLSARECNIFGSASSTGVACSGKNEDASDGTFDSCGDGSNNGFMWVENIYVNASSVLPGDVVNVTCEVHCWNSATEIAVAYHNGTTWRNELYGNCPSVSDAEVNISTSVRIDATASETHYFRCIEAWTGVSGMTCDSGTYADNDDMNISVIQEDVTSPTLYFGENTPSNASIQSANSLFINLTSGDSLSHYSFLDFDSSLALWMRMDDTNSSGDPSDLSSYSNDGSLEGDALINSTGYWGNGGHFDGSGDYILTSVWGPDARVDELTINAWILTSSSSPGVIFSYCGITGCDSSLNELHGGLTAGGGVDFLVSDQGGLVGATSVNDGAWHMVTWKIDHEAGEYFIYVDGVEDDNDGFFIAGATNFQLQLGGNSNGWPGFSGGIDEVLVFNRSLSQAEILSLYNASVHQYIRNFSNVGTGVHSFRGYAVDVVGNYNATESRVVTVSGDSIPPVLNLVSPVNESVFVESVFNVSLDVNVSDALPMDVFVHGSNSSNFFDEHSLLYQSFGAGNSIVTYNWSSSPIVPDSDSILTLHLDENGSSIRDFSGHGNNGGVSGAFFNASGGKFAGGYVFDGVDDFLEVSSSDSLNVSGAVTIAAWVRSDTEGYVLGKDSAGGLQTSYYVASADCSNINTVCTLPDLVAASSAATFSCTYVDSLPADAEVTRVSVSGAHAFTCGSVNIDWKWEDTTLGTYTDIDCSCGATAHPQSFSLDSPEYTLGGVNTINLEHSGSSWASLRGGSFAGLNAGEILNVTVDYTLDESVPFALSTLNGGEFLIANESDEFRVTFVGDVNDGAWHHLAATYDGALMRLYVDGVLVGVENGYSGDLPNNNLSVLIGGKPESSIPTDYFEGTLDEIGVWNRTLDDEAIADLYRLGEGIYFWKVNASDFLGNSAESLTRMINITSGGAAAEGLLTVLDSPANESVFVESVFNVSLNASFSGDGLLDIALYGANSSNNFYENGLLHKLVGQNSGVVTYNWTGSRIVPREESVLVLDFDDGAFDESFYAHNVTGFGATHESSGGKFAGGYVFDGVDDALIVNASQHLNLTQTVTIAAWVRSDAEGSVLTREKLSEQSNSFTAIQTEGTWGAGSSTTNIYAGEWNNEYMYGLTDFDVTSALGETISRALLNVSVQGVSGGEVVAAFRINESWSEASVTNSGNAPDYDRASQTTTSHPSGVGQTHAFDVTSIVQSWLNGSEPNHGIVITQPSSLNGVNNFSWFYGRTASPASRRPNLTLEFAPEEGSGVPFALGTEQGGRFAIERNGEVFETVYSGDVNDGAWHHLAATYDGAVMRLYVDGVLVDSNGEYSGNLPVNEGDVFIGMNSSGSDYFEGTLDEIGVWNRTLQSEEIRDLYRLRAGEYLWKANVSDVLGVSNESETREIVILDDLNSAPEISFVEDLGNVDPFQGSVNIVSLRFGVSDSDGIGDLNPVSIAASLHNDGLSVRTNTSCVALAGETSATSQNYSCSFLMQYYDAFGDWNVSVYAEDFAGSSARNDSTSFYYNLLQDISVADNPIVFSLSAEAENQTALSGAVRINNSGNYVGRLFVNGSDLVGSVSGDILSVGNFSVGNETGSVLPECGGTRLENGVNMEIQDSYLYRGDGAFGDLYFCIPEILENVPTQDYDGSWQIRIVSVLALVARKRKRILEDKLSKAIVLLAEDIREDYSHEKDKILSLMIRELCSKFQIGKKDLLMLLGLRQEVRVPLAIFRKELGALEALTKYLKENLGRSYREIAVLLCRSDRTIWSAYHKACVKHPGALGARGEYVSLNIFRKELTILESLIVYLKEEGRSYAAIGHLIERDQRNVRTIYLRAVEKFDSSGSRKDAKS